MRIWVSVCSTKRITRTSRSTHGHDVPRRKGVSEKFRIGPVRRLAHVLSTALWRDDRFGLPPTEIVFLSMN